MGDSTMPADAKAALERAGLPPETVAAWLRAEPAPGEAVADDYARAAADFTAFWGIGADLLARLTGKPRRNEAESAADGVIRTAGRAARERFLSRHVETLYRCLTDDFRRFVRVDDLAYEAAALL